MFHDKAPKKRYSIPKIDTKELVFLGRGLDIGYKSDKWTGQNQNYLHNFGKRIKLFATSDGKSLILKGPGLFINKNGING